MKSPSNTPAASTTNPKLASTLWAKSKILSPYTHTPVHFCSHQGRGLQIRFVQGTRWFQYPDWRRESYQRWETEKEAAPSGSPTTRIHRYMASDGEVKYGFRGNEQEPFSTESHDSLPTTISSQIAGSIRVCVTCANQFFFLSTGWDEGVVSMSLGERSILTISPYVIFPFFFFFFCLQSLDLSLPFRPTSICPGFVILLFYQRNNDRWARVVDNFFKLGLLSWKFSI